MPPLVTTVFGSTGVVGTTLIEVLSSQHPDWSIQAVTRSTTTTPRLASLQLSNVTLVQGDAMNLDQVMSLTEASDSIFCCIGFERYETKYWAQTWPTVVDNLLQATRGGTKTLIFCDNLYAYGSGSVISPRTPTVPAGLGSKMAVRSLLQSKFRQFIKDHPGSLVVVGASDFFGPHCTNSLLGDPLIGKIVNHQAPIGFGNKIHDFCYVPDLALALARVAVEPSAFDKFWIAPHSIHGKTLQEIAGDVSIAAGIKKPRSVSVIPSWVVHLVSPFWGIMYNMKDMLGIWTQDYMVDDSDMQKEFGLTATPYKEAIQKTVEYFVERAAATKKE